MLRKIVILPIVLIVLGFLAGCETEGRAIRGYAKDPCTGQAIAGATVTLTGPGQVTLTSMTDHTGYYTFDNLPGSSYDVTIEHDNYSFFPGSASVTIIRQNAVKTLDFSGLDTASAWRKEYRGLTYVSFSGTPEEIGCQHGIMLREEIKQLKNAKNAMTLLGMLDNAEEKVAPWLASESSFTQDEIKEMKEMARATGVANVGNPSGVQLVSLEEIAFFNIQVDAGGLGDEHCSGFAARSTATSDGELYQGFNWDAAPASSKLRTAISVLAFYHPKDEEGNAKNSFVAPIMAGSIGVYTGMNEKQLAIDSQATGGLNDNAPEVKTWRPLTALIRRSLEEANTINEMESILTADDAYRKIGVITIMTDGKTDDMAALEIIGHDHADRQPQGDTIWAANNIADPYWVSEKYTGPPITIMDSDRSPAYEALLKQPGGKLFGSVDVDTAINNILSISPICKVATSGTSDTLNGTSLVYVPKYGHIHVSTIAYPACKNTYLGFDLKSESPIY